MLTTEQSAVPEVVNNFLDGVGNHETKILLGSLFLMHANRSFTPDDMTDRMNKYPIREIKPDKIASYCNTSLGPIGGLITGELSWQANPEHLDTRLAMCGLLGRWSLRWMDLTVQQVYGKTTLAHPRSPRTRQALYTYIHKAEEPVSIFDAFNAVGQQYSGGGFRNHIYSLVDLELIEKYSNRTAPSEAKPSWRGVDRHSESTLTISPNVLRPITELVEGVEAIKEGKGIDDLCEQARQIARDAESARALVGNHDIAHENLSHCSVLKGQLVGFYVRKDGSMWLLGGQFLL